MLCVLIVCGIVNEKLTLESIGLRTQGFSYYQIQRSMEYNSMVQIITASQKNIVRGHSFPDLMIIGILFEKKLT